MPLYQQYRERSRFSPPVALEEGGTCVNQKMNSGIFTSEELTTPQDTSQLPAICLACCEISLAKSIYLHRPRVHDAPHVSLKFFCILATQKKVRAYLPGRGTLSNGKVWADWLEIPEVYKSTPLTCMRSITMYLVSYLLDRNAVIATIAAIAARRYSG